MALTFIFAVFFFQAEDGIRDLYVTGVQTCALRSRIRYGLLYFALAAAAWVALYESGVDPLVIGLAMGLLTFAYPAGRGELERATDLFRLFREQPTPEL